MIIRSGLLVIGAALAVAACTPEGQRVAECAGATALGAGVGGLVGNQIGGGTGQTLATVAGGATGAVLASNATGSC